MAEPTFTARHDEDRDRRWTDEGLVAELFDRFVAAWRGLPGYGPPVAGTRLMGLHASGPGARALVARGWATGGFPGYLTLTEAGCRVLEGRLGEVDRERG